MLRRHLYQSLWLEPACSRGAVHYRSLSTAAHHRIPVDEFPFACGGVLRTSDGDGAGDLLMGGKTADVCRNSAGGGLAASGPDRAAESAPVRDRSRSSGGSWDYGGTAGGGRLAACNLRWARRALVPGS